MSARESASTGSSGGRLLWMAVGPVCLLIAGIMIANKGGGWFTAADVVYFVAIGLMLFGRWLEFRGGHPTTATGEPATDADLRRYVLVTPLLGLAVWVVLNVVGNHWPGQAF